MIIVHPINIDYLIERVRLHIGDLVEPYRFSNELIRTALVNAVLALQRRWNFRYLVFSSGIVVDPLPEGYVYDPPPSGVTYHVIIPSGYILASVLNMYVSIPSGMVVYDVFRNPTQSYAASDWVIAQEDEIPIVLQASIMLWKTQLGSSAHLLGSWSDGEFSYSNIAGQRTLIDLIERAEASLREYFARRLANARRVSFLPF